MNCPQCGAEIPPSAQFCSQCGGQSVGGGAAVGLAREAPMSGLAIAGFVLAFFFFPLAIVFGHISLGRIRHSGGQLRGRGLALAAVIIGYSYLAITLALIGAAILLPHFLAASGR